MVALSLGVERVIAEIKKNKHKFFSKPNVVGVQETDI
jgi:hypothetical protein